MSLTPATEASLAHLRSTRDAVRARGTPPLPPEPCVRRGPVLRMAPCASGPGCGQIAVKACSLHWECTDGVLQAARGVRQCRFCDDIDDGSHAHGKAVPMDLLPGLPDPLPFPEVLPVPQNWADRRNVRRRHVEALHSLVTAPLPPDKPRSGDGVVMVGGGRYTLGLRMAVRFLRESGSTLPVWIGYRGKAEPITPEAIADLEAHGSALVDLDALAASRPAKDRPRTMRGWEQKTVGLLEAPFARALFLDADAYPVRDPRPLFGLLDHAPYVYWKDLPGTANNVKWASFGIDPAIGQKVPQIQGGHLLMDLAGFRRELVISHWLDMHSDYAYSRSFSDQDQYRIALALTGGRLINLGDCEWVHPAFDCRWAGRSWFVHRCQGKFLAGEKLPYFGKDLPLEARAFEMARELSVFS